MTPRQLLGLIERVQSRPYANPADQSEVLADLRDQLAQARRKERPVVLFARDGDAWLIGDPEEAPVRWRTSLRMAAWAAYDVLRDPSAILLAAEYSEAKDAATSVRNALKDLAAELEAVSRPLAVCVRRIRVIGGKLIYNPSEAPADVRAAMSQVCPDQTSAATPHNSRMPTTNTEILS